MCFRSLQTGGGVTASRFTICLICPSSILKHSLKQKAFLSINW
ncbi:hypothetical protein NEILACOT_04741 [Neisseria lactamica ATCC 23970]|uniref:Uncharacterized protein n=1 Tax=Neisseria lactamica ATCC 23970 TaxID=546265 RepID=D0WB17_NEILA|nr:hypothetical protein NEILACOT_04741 [Neisseria lactamica ATCC 23970]